MTIDGLEIVPPRDEHAMMQGVTQHPITVALCVGDWIKQWRAYTGGILQVPGLPAKSLESLTRQQSSAVLYLISSDMHCFCCLADPKRRAGNCDDPLDHAMIVVRLLHDVMTVALCSRHLACARAQHSG